MGDCRVCASTLASYALLWGWISLRVLDAADFSKESTAVVDVVATPCWQVEEFAVLVECAQCNAFQLKSRTACRITGYVEKINCAKSNKDEYKSCRSIWMEEHLFWKFEGIMVTLMVFFSIVVVLRQRALDRQASEKVRKQIESI